MSPMSSQLVIAIKKNRKNRLLRYFMGLKLVYLRCGKIKPILITNHLDPFAFEKKEHCVNFAPKNQFNSNFSGKVSA
jgi:hypothetical protein